MIGETTIGRPVMDNEDLEEVELLHHPDPRTRIQAVMKLDGSNDPNIIAPLGDLLINDEDSEVRARAATVLGRLDNPAAAPFLIQALADENIEVKRRVVKALTEIKDPSFVEPLITALTDPDRDVRRWAARALGQIGDSRAMEPLNQLRTDPNLVVRNEVVQALQLINDRQQLQEQHKIIDNLREQQNKIGADEPMAQVQLEGEIDLKQLQIYQLEARVAASQLVQPAEEIKGSEQDRERQTYNHELKQLIRELKSLYESAQASQLRSYWDNQLREANEVANSWQDSRIVLAPETMREELQRLRHNKDERLDAQNRELIEIVRFVGEGYNIKLRMQRNCELLSDPRNRLLVESWISEVDADYELLLNARKQGNYQLAVEYHKRLADLSQQAQDIIKQEEEDKAKANKLVIRFVTISLVLLVVIIIALSLLKLATTTIPILGISLSVVIWSALGALAAMLYQFINRPVSQLETVKWLFARPIQGIIMGSFLSLVAAAGFVVLGTDPANPQTATVNQTALAVIAFLGGFSDRFSEAMVKRTTSILSPTTPDAEAE